MNGKLTGILYAVFRINNRKIKKLTDIKQFKKHLEREKEVLNADKERSIENKILIGGSDLYKDFKEYIKPCKLRKNGNLAHEIILTASREYFRNIDDKEKEMWIEANVNFLKNKFGGSCIYAVLHNDETTPHIHALISRKAKDKKGNTIINNSYFFDGATKLRNWQDEYGNAMSEFNLSRGIKFSKATHVQLRHFYALVENEINVNKLIDVLDNNYKFKHIKEEFTNIANKLDFAATENNKKDIEELKQNIYKLSFLTTAPEKFYNENKVLEQREKVNNLITNLNLDMDIDINYLTRDYLNKDLSNFQKGINIVANTRIKREVIELKKKLKYLNSECEIKDKDNIKYIEQIKRLREDKAILKDVIMALSEYYYIPQRAIESIIDNVYKNAESKIKKMDNVLERKL